MTILEPARAVTGGVGTHLDVNVAAVLDDIGGLGVEEFATDAGGHRKLLPWLESFGAVARVGVEGTGSYGVGLSRALRSEGVEVIEVDRPNRLVRRRQGESDPVDAWRRPEPCCRAGSAASARAGTGTWRPSGR